MVSDGARTIKINGNESPNLIRNGANMRFFFGPHC
jgi:hypothetical protein